MNIQMHNFCEDQFDSESGGFGDGGTTSGGRAWLNDEGPYGADCDYYPDKGVSHEHHLNEQFFCLPILIIFIGLVIWGNQWNEYKDLKNRVL